MGDAGTFSTSAEVARGGHGVGVRLPALFRCERRKKASWAGWAKRLSGPAGPLGHKLGGKSLFN
jgi:hypothetical protein